MPLLAWSVALIANLALVALSEGRASASDVTCDWGQVQSARRLLANSVPQTTNYSQLYAALINAPSVRTRDAASSRMEKWATRALALGQFSQGLEICAELKKGGYPIWQEHFLAATTALDLEGMSDSDNLMNDTVISSGLVGVIRDPNAPSDAKVLARRVWMQRCAVDQLGAGTPKDLAPAYCVDLLNLQFHQSPRSVHPTTPARRAVPRIAHSKAQPEPCGFVDFFPIGEPSVDESTGQVFQRLSMTVHFSSGSVQTVDLDWSFYYPNRSADPFLAGNSQVPAVFQFPSVLQRTAEPALVQYVMKHTTPDGYTKLHNCAVR